MIVSSVSNTKNKLSAFLEQVRQGETLVITDHNRPIAKIERMDASEDLDVLIREGVVTPAVQSSGLEAFFKLPLAKAPGAKLAEAVAEDRAVR